MLFEYAYNPKLPPRRLVGVQDFPGTQRHSSNYHQIWGSRHVAEKCSGLEIMLDIALLQVMRLR